MTEEKPATDEDPETAGEEDESATGEEATGDEEIPQETVEEAERLTRLARDAVDDAEAETYLEDRDELVAEHEFAVRVREDDTNDVLVLHPEEWVEDGRIRVERVEDTDRAVEIRLDGPGDPEDWEAVDAHNAEVADRVHEEHGEVHGENARAFADFMSNHYARPVESATSGEVEEFLNEYYPRNAWPSKKQRKAVGESVELVFDEGDE
ncbi:DUF7108 family protein [Halorussus halophilus]|uniref:DUF7108 family protein n=1 Tax=Halorussus halophilus TaxID=2650975 RepID=UPI0017884B90|nr:rnhA operon protein [Halorussus halophilus]